MATKINVDRFPRLVENALDDHCRFDGPLVSEVPRTPANGGALVDPPFRQVRQLISENRQNAIASFDLCGVPRGELMQAARDELVRLATNYTGSYREVHLEQDASTAPIIMSGHQPTLFHPGVWFKNVALSHLAAAHHAIGVHLIVDNDQVAAPAIDVPQVNGTSITRNAVPLDAAQSARPYEEWQIRDRAQFNAAGAKIAGQVAQLAAKPIIERLWPRAMAAADRHGNLGLALSQARHEFEAGWQLKTLELPVSRMSDTDSFRHFCGHILNNVQSFQEVYNREVLRYRKAHHIRSQAHPVPVLRAGDGWFEAPFWTWSSTSPQRQPLFVRHNGDRLELRTGLQGEIREAPAADCEIVRWLHELRDGGVKIRPRALSMTMYTRLILCDLFLHGIGGAKYDELGDTITEAFFGVRPGEFMTLSATVQLPLGSSQVDADDIRQLDGCLRDLYFHPDRHIDLGSPKCSVEAGRLVRRKQVLLVSQPPRGHRKAWHREIVEINQQLRVSVAETREMLLGERTELTRQLQNETVLRSREFSFALFPESRLKQLLLDLCDAPR